MAVISYLRGGESATAASINLLFEELDRKIGLAMGGKSLMWALYRFQSYFGKKFYFISGDTVYASQFGATGTYDHSTFTAYASAASIIETDITKRLTRFAQDTQLLDGSLEAHADVDGNYLFETDRTITEIFADIASGVFVNGINYRPEMTYRLALAEIVVEGETAVTIKGTWDKYNFFRFNNLNLSDDVEITFKNSEDASIFTHTLPAGESICIRRDSTDAGYLLGFKYFQKLKAGDWHFWQVYSGGLTSNPATSMFANNVANVSVAIDLIGNMKSSDTAPLFRADDRIVCDLAELYKDTFPAVEQNVTSELYEIPETAKVFDALFHKGELAKVKRKIEPATAQQAYTIPLATPPANYDQASGHRAVLTSDRVLFEGIDTFEAACDAAGFTLTINPTELLLEASGSNISTVNEDYANGVDFSVSVDLFPLTTNVFNARPFGRGVEFHKDDDVFAANTFAFPIPQPLANVAPAVVNSVSTELGGITFYENNLVELSATGEAFPTCAGTIADMLKFDHWGASLTDSTGADNYPATIPTGQDTASAAFTDRSAKLTPCGLVATYRRDIDYSIGNPASVISANSSNNYAAPYTFQADGTTETVYNTGAIYWNDRNIAQEPWGAVYFSCYGFPTYASKELLLSPRDTRCYAATKAASIDAAGDGSDLHPRFGGAPKEGLLSIAGIAGYDFTELSVDTPTSTLKIAGRTATTPFGIGSLGASTPYAYSAPWVNKPFFNYDHLQRAMAAGDDVNAANVFSSPLEQRWMNDVLASSPEEEESLVASIPSLALLENYAHRPLLSAETYNHVAMLINQVDRYVPFSFEQLWWRTADDSYIQLTPIEAGIIGDGTGANPNIRPLTQYSQVSGDSSGYQAEVFAALGIPILDSTSFPSDYASAIGTPLERLTGMATFSCGIEAVDDSDPDNYIYSGTATLSGVSTSTELWNDTGDQIQVFGHYVLSADLAPGFDSFDDYRWVTTFDVADYAESIGFPLRYNRLIRRFSIDIAAGTGTPDMQPSSLSFSLIEPPATHGFSIGSNFAQIHDLDQGDPIKANYCCIVENSGGGWCVTLGTAGLQFNEMVEYHPDEYYAVMPDLDYQAAGQDIDAQMDFVTFLLPFSMSTEFRKALLRQGGSAIPPISAQLLSGGTYIEYSGSYAGPQSRSAAQIEASVTLPWIEVERRFCYWLPPQESF